MVQPTPNTGLKEADVAWLNSLRHTVPHLGAPSPHVEWNERIDRILSALPPVVEAPGDQEGELIKRLRARPGADHERGCDGRNYECTCGYNDANDSLFIEAADALSSPEPGGSEFVPIPLSDEVVSYVARYGGMCRDCADEAGVCPNSGLPCDDDGDKAIRHVIKALNYGFGKGYLKFPEASQGSVAATRPEVAP